MPKISEAQKQARRQAFLTAALECLRTTSYARVTIDEICSEAGASKGAFYLYFHSKKDLLLALLDEHALAFERFTADSENERLSAVDLLERFAQTQLREARDPAQLQLRADVWGMATTDPAVRERLRFAIARRRAVLRDWIEQSIVAGELALDARLANAVASSLLALFDGLALHRGIDPRGFRWKNVRAVLDSFARDSGG